MLKLKIANFSEIVHCLLVEEALLTRVRLRETGGKEKSFFMMRPRVAEETQALLLRRLRMLVKNQNQGQRKGHLMMSLRKCVKKKEESWRGANSEF